MEANTITSPRKSAARTFLEMAAAGKAREAMARWAAPSFRHHNPYFAGDADSLARAMDENALRFPQKRLEVLHAIEEGDLVMVHSRVLHAPGGPEAAVVHLFRFEDGRVMELWDVGQEIPKDSPNRHGAF